MRAGDYVEVRSLEEILATLDAQGSIDGLPFMPEMARFCGRRFRVHKVADKACDTIHYGGSRRMRDTVHLENVRCDGSGHGGCDAWCLMYWKEAWLKPVARPTEPWSEASSESVPIPVVVAQAALQANSRPDDVIWRCQVTDLLKATTPMKWWDPRQYARDVLSGNIRLRELFYAACFRIYRTWLWKGKGYRASLAAYNKFQRATGGVPFPHMRGRLDKTPKETLGLQPGEWVQVKSQEEILATVNNKNRNRGLSFDAEMVPYCGGTFRVAKRVNQIIDEPTGRMTPMKGDCIILEGVVCTSKYSDKRLFCPREIPPFWREIWLRRVENEGAGRAPEEPETLATAEVSDTRTSHERPHD